MNEAACIVDQRQQRNAIVNISMGAATADIERFDNGATTGTFWSGVMALDDEDEQRVREAVVDPERKTNLILYDLKTEELANCGNVLRCVVRLKALLPKTMPSGKPTGKSIRKYLIDEMVKDTVIRGICRAKNAERCTCTAWDPTNPCLRLGDWPEEGASLEDILEDLEVDLLGDKDDDG